MIKAKRCTECSKIIDFNNLSGLCEYHSRKELHKKKVRKICHVCGEECSGNMLIRYRSNAVISVCTRHFNKLNLIQSPQDIRKEITRLKSYH